LIKGARKMDVINSKKKRFCWIDIDRMVLPAIGGALLGGSIYAGIGAVIGGVLVVVILTCMTYWEKMPQK